MKKLRRGASFVVVAYLALALALSACDFDSPSVDYTKRDGIEYTVVRSPVTGACYEVVAVNGAPSISGIWQVDCKYFDTYGIGNEND